MKSAKIQPSEMKVMNVLWEDSPMRASEIVERLSAQTSWSVNTIYTLIGGIFCVAYTCIRERREWVNTQMPRSVLDLFEQERAQYGRSNNVNIAAAKCSSPHISGFLCPRSMIPERLLEEEMPEEVLRAVFRHEFGHLTQGDFWTWKLRDSPSGDSLVQSNFMACISTDASGREIGM